MQRNIVVMYPLPSIQPSFLLKFALQSIHLLVMRHGNGTFCMCRWLSHLCLFSFWDFPARYKHHFFISFKPKSSFQTNKSHQIHFSVYMCICICTYTLSYLYLSIFVHTHKHRYKYDVVETKNA